MSSKHRLERRRSPRVLWFLVGALFSAVVGSTFAIWTPGTASPAASKTVLSPEEFVGAQTSLPGLQRLVVYGHSMPTGGGASDETLGYTWLAAEETGLELVNRAEGHTTAATAADVMAAAPSAGPTDVVLIHTGMNDIFRRGDRAAVTGRAAIERLLEGAAEARRRVVVLECQPATWEGTPPHRDMQPAYEAWNAMVRGVAAAHDGVELLDTCEGWDPERYTDAPKYHPNDAGHALLAEELVALLRGAGPTGT
jgi:lysophospholipase L1-like esterase